MRYLVATGIAAGLTIALAGAAFAREVGDVQAVERSAFGTPPDASKEAKHAGDAVDFKELLETLAQSGMLVRFSDGSKLTLGAQSQVLVDDFVYDPGNPTSKALISLPAGKLRYITGSMPKGQTTIDTPSATMVLRGTNVAVDSRSDGTLLYVEEGSVSVHSKQTGQDTLVKQGQSVLIGANGIVSTSIERTGDPLVDDGFASNTPTPTNGQNEPRRGDGGHHESASSGGSSGKSSGSTGGGSTGGGSTGGGSTGGTGGSSGGTGGRTGGGSYGN